MKFENDICMNCSSNKLLYEINDLILCIDCIRKYNREICHTCCNIFYDPDKLGICTNCLSLTNPRSPAELLYDLFDQEFIEV
jgi:hypothetical protein